MEKQILTQQRVLSFRHWSRKSYAIFSSLGKLIRIAVLCFGYSILTMPCSAQASRDTLQTPESISEHELDEVVVTAQRSPVLQSQLMRVVQVITRAEIEQAPAADLTGLLEHVRGVDLRKRGAYGMQADISIRGGTFDQTLILINGINITDPQTGHHNLNVPIDLQSIDRIEVLQGPGARIFGPNAFNGAINIITNQPGGDKISASVSGGDFGFAQAGISASTSLGKWHQYVSAHGITSQGHVANTDFTTGNLYYRAQIPLGASQMDAQTGYNKKAFGANSFYTPRFPDQFEETRTLFASLKIDKIAGIPITPLVYWRRHHDRFELFRNEAPPWYTSHNHHMSDVAGAAINWMHSGTRGVTSLGLDYRFEHIFSNVLGNRLNVPIPVKGYPGDNFTHSYQRSGLSFMKEHTLYQGPFTISTGLLTYLNSDLEKGISFFPGIDLGWQITDILRWYSSFNRTMRLPTFTDLFYSGPTNMGNPALQPEKAYFAETGVKKRIGIIEADLAIFRRWGINMIDWIREPGDELWQSMNHTRVDITGFETGFALPLGPQLGTGIVKPMLSVQYSYIYSDKASGDFVSNYVLDYLKHKLDISFTHRITPRGGATWRASWQDRAGGYMLYHDGAFQEIQDFDPFWMIDLRLFYQVRNIQLFAEATNLFNVDYVSVANVPQPGRWARIGARLELDLSR